MVGANTAKSAEIDAEGVRTEALAFAEPVVLPGAIVGVLYLAAVVLGRAHVPSQPFKFVEYGLLGLTLAVGLLLLANANRWPAPHRRWVIGVCVCITMIACVEYNAFASNGLCAVCALIQTGFAAAFGAFRGVSRSARPFARAVTFLVGLTAWTTAVHMPWWSDFVYLRSVVPYFIGVFGIILLFVLTAVYSGRAIPWPKAPARVSTIGRFLFDGLVLAFIASTGFRTSGLFTAKLAFHHWGVFVGPAEMIRQGGWLLWDVPSQYGFLSILLLAALPFHSIWTALHVLIGACQTVSAFALYLCLLTCLRNPLGRLVAAAVSIASVFIMPCYGVVYGPQIMPSTTSFRFLWVYVILGALALFYRSQVKREAGDTIDLRPLIAGCVAWVLGVFWSFECAYWVTAIWIPAYGLILWQEWKLMGGSFGRRLRTLASIPAALLSLGVGLIDVIYRVRLGHGPDWSCYGEYVRAFSDGFGQLVMNYQGSIWVVFLCCMIPAVTAVFLFRKSPVDPAVPVLVGAAASVFAVASYCIGRSHPNNVLNILPVCFVAVAFALRLSRRIDGSLTLLTRACVVPFFAIVISASIGIPVIFEGWVAGTLHPGPIALDHRLPRFDAEARSLLTKAHIGDRTPLAFFDLDPTRVVDGSTADLDRPYWTPLSPFGAVTPLQPHRAVRYLTRFLARTHESGWLLIPRKADWMGFDIPWAIPSIEKFYRPAQTLQSKDYTLIYFVPRDLK